MHPPGVGRRLFNPFTMAREVPKEQQKYLDQLIAMGKGFSMPSETLLNGAVDLTDMKYADPETGLPPYSRMLQLMGTTELTGRTLWDEVTRMMDTQEWQDASAGITSRPGGLQHQILSDIITGYQELALAIVRQEYPVVDQAVRTERLKDLGAKVASDEEAFLEELTGR
jgi:hypothetical protein